MRMEPVQILLVEDNPADADLMTEMFRDIRGVRRIHVVTDGLACLAFLRPSADHEKAPRPDLIVLDLNLPRMDGRRVLAEIKRDPELRRIPVIILTSSDAESDVANSYDLHANCYLKKPVDLKHFARIVRAIDEFWLTLAELPS